MDMSPPSPATSSDDDDSCWRDWTGHPDLLHAMWPNLLASSLPPSSWLALLGTCCFTRDATLREAPHVKLMQHLDLPDPHAPQANLNQNLDAAEPHAPSRAVARLRSSERTKPTTLTLVHAPAPDQPRPAAAPEQGRGPLPASAPLPYAISMKAQHIISQLSQQGITAVTRLQLHAPGMVVDSPMLQVMQGLPALTHLDLCRVNVPSHTYQFDWSCYPRNLHTLTLHLNNMGEPGAYGYANLLAGFLARDTIDDLTVIPQQEFPRYSHGGVLTSALQAIIRAGRPAHALRKLSMPEFEFGSEEVEILRQSAPLVEHLEVGCFETDYLSPEDEPLDVMWRTVRVEDLHLCGCCALPLGGTAGDLEMHITRRLMAFDASSAVAGIAHLLSEANPRRVRLVGGGREGGSYEWYHSSDLDESIPLQEALSVLQLSKNPVTRLDLINLSELKTDDLLAALGPLPHVTQLKINMRDWVGSTPDLLARLPLHVERVCLDGGGRSSMKAFRGMVVRASRVPARQSHPLRVCVRDHPVDGGEPTPLGPGSEVWQAVDSCWAGAQGASELVACAAALGGFKAGAVEGTGVVMEDHWDWSVWYP